MMINRLFEFTNWSTVPGAPFFWHLILVCGLIRSRAYASDSAFSFSYVAMLPITLASAARAFSQSNRSPVYAVCGRFLPISPVADLELWHGHVGSRRIAVWPGVLPTSRSQAR